MIAFILTPLACSPILIFDKPNTMQINHFPYNKVNNEILLEIREAVGDHLLTDADAVVNFTSDESKLTSIIPEIVVFPQTTEEVSKIMKIAYSYSIPVTPRGAGTNVTGAAIPIYGGIVMSLEKMNKLLEIDKENMMAVCEPGIINITLQNKLSEHNLFYPPDPASVNSCTIGGNVAQCAGGMKAVKYGVTKDYVLGLEVVLTTGEIITLGGKLRKNVTGYDILGLLIGSEGTLGVITKIILKVLPLPRYKIDLWIPFSSYTDALTFLPKIYQSQYVPSVIEFLEKDCIKAWEKLEKKKHQYSNAQAHIIIELDGNHLEMLEKESTDIAKLAEDNNAMDILYADTPALQNKIWEIRRKISEALRFIGGKKVSEDIVVPPSEIFTFMKKLKVIAKETGFKLIGYGHLGDGNIHVNILKCSLTETMWKKNLHEVITRIFSLAISLGGTITGEHGIGLTKKEYLQEALGDTNYLLMRKIKNLFDPKNILNPGKIFKLSSRR
ncbi:MAG TPA: hypothetical protein DF296_07230 [Candidatus Margulisbacteria bacterium]|nr:hypothetical protein [Candidatus Margulisiibacteriota bacterium]HCT84978.1 hypothetical protein [Candidatus Margulisiibacteriota bacterium]